MSGIFQLSRREMLACAALLFASHARSEEQDRYEVLGLRLGMTAKEAEAVIANRFHTTTKQKGLLILPGNPRYVPSRAYTMGISFKPVGPNSGVWQVPELELGLNFAEVCPGERRRPEALWSVEYQPTIKTDSDKQVFVKSVIEKYGEPTKIFDRREYVWADKDYGWPMNFDQAEVPVLHLTTYLPKLKLSNAGIQKHMDDLFNSKQSKKVPLL